MLEQWSVGLDFIVMIRLTCFEETKPMRSTNQYSIKKILFSNTPILQNRQWIYLRQNYFPLTIPMEHGLSPLKNGLTAKGGSIGEL